MRWKLAAYHITYLQDQSRVDETGSTQEAFKDELNYFLMAFLRHAFIALSRKQKVMKISFLLLPIKRNSNDLCINQFWTFLHKKKKLDEENEIFFIHGRWIEFLGELNFCDCDEHEKINQGMENL